MRRASKPLPSTTYMIDPILALDNGLSTLRCWPLPGDFVQLTIALSRVANITGITSFKKYSLRPIGCGLGRSGRTRQSCQVLPPSLDRLSTSFMHNFEKFQASDCASQYTNTVSNQFHSLHISKPISCTFQVTLFTGVREVKGVRPHENATFSCLCSLSLSSRVILRSILERLA